MQNSMNIRLYLCQYVTDFSPFLIKSTNIIHKTVAFYDNSKFSQFFNIWNKLCKLSNRIYPFINETENFSFEGKSRL